MATNEPNQKLQRTHQREMDEGGGIAMSGGNTIATCMFSAEM